MRIYVYRARLIGPIYLYIWALRDKHHAFRPLTSLLARVPHARMHTGTMDIINVMYV